MSHVVKNIPNLIGGVSQQPPELRLPGQCEEQINFISSPVNGLQTRPPVIFKSSSAFPTDAAFFICDRDQSHTYNLFIHPTGGIQVEDTAGNVYPVTGDTSYLALPSGVSPRDGYAILQVADTIFILNRTRPTCSLAQVTNAFRREALVHIKQVNYNTSWSLSLNGTVSTFGYGSDTTKTTSVSEVLTNLVSGLGSAKDSFDITQVGSILHIRRKDGGGFDIGLSDSRGGTYSALVTDRIQNFTDLPTVAPEGFVCKIIGSGASDADDYYVKFRVHHKISNSVTRKKIPDPHSFFLGGFLYDRPRFDFLPSDKDLYHVGERIQRGDLKATILRIEHYPSIRWETESDKHGTIIHTRPEHYTAYLSAGLGFNQPDTRETWIETDTPLSSSVGNGVWEETVAPDISKGLDSATMPHILVHHLQNDTWSFDRADWTERRVGDNDSNPLPSFIGRPLNWIFLHHNRMGVLTDDHLVMSASGDFGNFFIESAQILSDSDPIDIAVTSGEQSPLLRTVTINENLYIFSSKRQYILTGPDVFSPKTASVIESTAYDCLPDCGLVSQGDRLYFLNTTTDCGTVYEHIVDETRSTQKAVPITAHVPTYLHLEGKPVIIGAGSANILAIHDVTQPHRIYIYICYISGGEKLQSAWFTFDIPSIAISSLGFREDHLWLIGTVGTSRVKALIDLAPAPVRAVPKNLWSIDCQTFSISEAPSKSITIPQALVVPDRFPTVIDLETGRDVPVKAQSGATLSLAYPVLKAAVGYTYTSRYTFTQFYVTKTRNNVESAITDGRFQLKRLVLSHNLSGPFKATVTNTWTGESVTYNTGITVGTSTSKLGVPFQSSGSFTVPCRGRNTEVRVSVETDNPIPLALISADLYGYYVKKARSV